MKVTKDLEVKTGCLIKKKNEHALQAMCVKWFRYAHPGVMLFAVPNGGARSAVTGAVLKSEGALPGVADLFLCAPSVNADGQSVHGLFIEMKTETGVWRKNQQEFAAAVRAAGYRYEVVRTFDRFAGLCDEYVAGAKAVQENGGI
jgi:hypothetical protein